MPLLSRVQSRYVYEVESLWWDRRLGVSTRGFDARRFTPEHCYCGPTPYRRIFEVFDHFSLGKTDVLVDLGCGKGRIVCCAGRYEIRQAVGIEDVSEFAELARLNATRLIERAREISIHNQAAETFDYDEATIIYMCNPFGVKVLSKVIARLQDSLQRNPRGLRIAYCNPEHAALLDRTPWLVRYATWSGRHWWGYLPPVSFWRTLDLETVRSEQQTVQ